ncbi:MAG: tol-pal system protein YbgF [Alphaproteobacteria bacterium]|nr:tol-pal system protein YbgF [Alphaproteobacteria bacterium]|tara:strand:- start:7424 stop:8329 length:906 start_codon:yes stop_codon:yes gene_type:complete
MNNMMKKIYLSLCLVTAALMGSGSAFAQNYKMDQRIERLERDINTLSRAVYKGDLSQQPSIVNEQSGGMDTNYRVSVENRLSAMEQQLQQLTGQVEELNFRLNKLQPTGQATGLSPQQVPPGLTYQAPTPNGPVQFGTQNYNAQAIQASDLPPSVAPADQTEQPNADSTLSFGANDAKDYEQAFAQLKEGNYPAAQDGFKAFLDLHKDSNLVPNALYWLGETYYVQKQFSDAARVFAQGYQNHSESNKRDDYLLKLGLSLAGMEKKEDACIALMQLVKQGAQETPVVSRAKQEAKKLGCSL